MRKFVNYFVIALAFVFAGCNSQEGPFTPEEPERPDRPMTPNTLEFTATMEAAETSDEPSTKTFLEGIDIRWSKNDKIVVFEGNGSAPFTFQVQDHSVNSSIGDFTFVSPTQNAGEGTDLNGWNIAYYPYDSQIPFGCQVEDASKDQYRLTSVYIPSHQTYVKGIYSDKDKLLRGSFSPDAFPMVAMSKNNQLRFRNLCGTIKLHLQGTTGNEVVRSIKLMGNQHEKISGMMQAIVSPDPEVDPVIDQSNMTSMDHSCEEIVLDCGAGVALSTDDVTEFVFSLPPTHFKGGFSFIIYLEDGTSMAQATTKSKQVQRSLAMWMKPFSWQKQLIIEYSTRNAERMEVKQTEANKLFWENAHNDFYDADAGLGRVYMLKGTHVITKNAFYEFSSLQTISLPDGVTKIEANAFDHTTSLEEIIIPESVTSIGASAFSFAQLKNVVLPRNLKVISTRLFEGCSNLETVDMGNQVEQVQNYAFNLSGLMNINLPQSLISIGEGAFANCNFMYSITIPSNVSSIGYRAFYKSSRLKDVTVKSQTHPALDAEAFDWVSDALKIHVPADQVDAYKAAPGWSLYADKIVGK